MIKAKSPVEDFKGGPSPELTVVLRVFSMHQREQKRIMVVVQNIRTYPVWVPTSTTMEVEPSCTKTEQLIAEG